MIAELRYWLACIRHWLTNLGYVIRPYDMIADQRRWFWQKPAQCGSQWAAGLSYEARASLAAFAKVKDAFRERPSDG